MTTLFPQMSLDHLTDRCKEESAKRDASKRDDRFCYELVRRAFGLDDQDALNRVFNIYMAIWSQFWIGPIFGRYNNLQGCIGNIWQVEKMG